MTKITLPAKKFACAAVAASVEAMRYYLCGVYIENDRAARKVRMTATDGHMLITAQHDRAEEDEFAPFILSIDKQTVSILKAARNRKVETIVLQLEEKTWHAMTAHGQELEMGRFEEADGNFPQYNRVIPVDARATGRETMAMFPPATIARICNAASYAGAATFGISGAGPNDPHLIQMSGADIDGDICGAVMPSTKTRGEPVFAPGWARELLKS